MQKMVQYSVWSNCCNNCDFCLRKERIPYTKQKQLSMIHFIQENIKSVDWINEFSSGVSLLGGELYYITDEELQNSFLSLIDIIIKYILIPNKDKTCMYSSVTNGMYEPSFLYKVIDKIVEAVGINHIDINFSYDLKYRYHTEEARQQVLKNINEFTKRYDYKTGVQMILTQYVIDKIKSNEFDIPKFLEKDIPNCNFAFLYPHPIATKKKLNDFFFSRKDLLWVVMKLKEISPDTYYNFIYSTKNSGTFKHTGLIQRDMRRHIDLEQQPTLSDGKEDINPVCGHSTLYQCYNDSDKCMLCDLMRIDSDII